MPRRLRPGRGKLLRVIPARFCAWRRALPHGVELRPLPGSPFAPWGYGAGSLGLYLDAAPPVLIGVLERVRGGWRGSFLSIGDRPVGVWGRGLRGTAWAVLAEAARLASERVAVDGVTHLRGHAPGVAACCACALRAAGFAPAPPEDHCRRWKGPARERARRRARSRVWG